MAVGETSTARARSSTARSLSPMLVGHSGASLAELSGHGQPQTTSTTRYGYHCIIELHDFLLP